MGDITVFLINLEKTLLKEYNQILQQEEIFWAQKSRCNWINFGDRNTSYFHTKTIIRRQRNKIGCLKDSSNNWVWEEDQLKKLAVDFYKHLFTGDEVPNDEISFFSAFPDLENSHSSGLLEKVSDEEIRKAVFDMKPLKAPGPDGFQPYFFQTQWSVVGGDLCRFIKEVFANKQEVAEVNYHTWCSFPKFRNLNISTNSGQ